MSYTPTEWNTGDTITAEKLNKLEAGVAAEALGVDLIIHATATQESDWTVEADYTPEDVDCDSSIMVLKLIYENGFTETILLNWMDMCYINTVVHIRDFKSVAVSRRSEEVWALHYSYGTISVSSSGSFGTPSEEEGNTE